MAQPIHQHSFGQTESMKAGFDVQLGDVLTIAFDGHRARQGIIRLVPNFVRAFGPHMNETLTLQKGFPLLRGNLRCSRPPTPWRTERAESFFAHPRFYVRARGVREETIPAAGI